MVAEPLTWTQASPKESESTQTEACGLRRSDSRGAHKGESDRNASGERDQFVRTVGNRRHI